MLLAVISLTLLESGTAAGGTETVVVGTVKNELSKYSTLGEQRVMNDRISHACSKNSSNTNNEIILFGRYNVLLQYYISQEGERNRQWRYIQ